MELLGAICSGGEQARCELGSGWRSGLGLIVGCYCLGVGHWGHVVSEAEDQGVMYAGSFGSCREALSTWE